MLTFDNMGLTSWIITSFNWDRNGHGASASEASDSGDATLQGTASHGVFHHPATWRWKNGARIGRRWRFMASSDFRRPAATEKYAWNLCQYSFLWPQVQRRHLELHPWRELGWAWNLYNWSYKWVSRSPLGSWSWHWSSIPYRKYFGGGPRIFAQSLMSPRSMVSLSWALLLLLIIMWAKPGDHTVDIDGERPVWDLLCFFLFAGSWRHMSPPFLTYGVLTIWRWMMVTNLPG